MYKAPTEPLTIGGVLDDGLRIYRETFTKVWVFGLIAGIISLPLTFTANQLDPEAPSLPAIGAFFLIIFVMSMVTLILYAMLIARMDSIVRGQAMSFGAAVGRGLRRAPAYIGAALLFALMIGLAVMLTVLIAAIIVALTVAVLGAGGESPVAAVLTILIATLFGFLPAAYLSVTFFFYNYAAVMDDKSPIGALAYSVRLIRGHWWRTAAVLTIAFFIIGVAYIIVIVVTGAADIAAATGSALPRWLTLLMDYVIAPAFQVVLSPLFYALPMAVYNDLKLRREGSDLAARIAAAD
jgi:hypothetical protein